MFFRLAEICIFTSFLLGCTPHFAPNPADGQSKLDGIIGGTPLSSGDLDYTSIVLILDANSGGVCTGTLIAEHFVLTAAHCINSKNFDQTYIEFSSTLKLDRSGAHADFALVHRQYGAERSVNANDLALIHFPGGIPKNRQKAELAKDPSLVQNNAQIVIAGFGISDDKKQTGLGLLRTVTLKITDAHYSPGEFMVDQSTGKGACHGDSGGPVFIRTQGRLRLAGITSRTEPATNDHCDQIGIYTNVLRYSSWLNSNLDPSMRDLNAANSRLIHAQ